MFSKLVPRVRSNYDGPLEVEDVIQHLECVNGGAAVFNKIKSDNLCLAGGVALNCVANEKLFQKSKFKEMFIFPASSDSGVPFGLAAWGYYNLAKEKKKIAFNNAFTGSVYSSNEIVKLLSNHKIPFKNINDTGIAQLISNGKIVLHVKTNGQNQYPKGPRGILKILGPG